MRENKDLGACSRRAYTISDDSTKGTKPILKNKSDREGRLKGGMWGSNPRTKTPNISLCILLIFSKLVFQFLGNCTDFVSVVSRFFAFEI